MSQSPSGITRLQLQSRLAKSLPWQPIAALERVQNHTPKAGLRAQQGALLNVFNNRLEATMNTVGTYLLYLLISIGLTVVVGTGVARSGRALLLDVFCGNDALARAVSRLLVLGFYLLSLGFVTLTMREGGQVTSATAGVQLLSVKVGEVLLVLGALHLLTMAALLRARRLAQARLTQNPFRSSARWGAAAPTTPPGTGDAAGNPGPAQPGSGPAGAAPLAGSVLQ
jgi:hypothetical protein